MSITVCFDICWHSISRGLLLLWSLRTTEFWLDYWLNIDNIGWSPMVHPPILWHGRDHQAGTGPWQPGQVRGLKVHTGGWHHHHHHHGHHCDELTLPGLPHHGLARHVVRVGVPAGAPDGRVAVFWAFQAQAHLKREKWAFWIRITQTWLGTAGLIQSWFLDYLLRIKDVFSLNRAT